MACEPGGSRRRRRRRRRCDQRRENGKSERQSGGWKGEVRGEGLAGRLGAENGIGAYCSVTLSI